MAVLSGCGSGPATLPEGLRATADTGAAQFGTDERVRRQYLDNFRRGAVDALVWADLVENSRRDSANACAAGGDPQMRIIECAYADGVDAAIARRGALTLADFGFQAATVVQRVAARADSSLRFVEAMHRGSWLLAPSPVADRLDTGGCYRLTGYLAADPPDESRYPGFSAQFVVMEALAASSCLPPGRK